MYQPAQSFVTKEEYDAFIASGGGVWNYDGSTVNPEEVGVDVPEMSVTRTPEPGIGLSNLTERLGSHLGVQSPDDIVFIGIDGRVYRRWEMEQKTAPSPVTPERNEYGDPVGTIYAGGTPNWRNVGTSTPVTLPPVTVVANPKPTAADVVTIGAVVGLLAAFFN